MSILHFAMYFHGQQHVRLSSDSPTPSLPHSPTTYHVYSRLRPVLSRLTTRLPLSCLPTPCLPWFMPTIYHVYSTLHPVLSRLTTHPRLIVFTYTKFAAIHACHMSCQFYTSPCTFMLNNTSAFYHVHLHHVYPDSHLPCIMSTLYLILYFNTYQHVCLLSRLPTPYPHSRPHIMFHTINPCFWSNPLCI